MQSNTVAQTEIVLYFPGRYGQGARTELAGREIPELIRSQWLDTLLDQIASIKRKDGALVGGATVAQARGLWQGVEEKTTLLSVIVDGLDADGVYAAFRSLACDVKRYLYQDSVLLSARPIYAEFV